MPIAGQVAGYVVTHVPIGMHVPYRTLVDKEEYYIRAGSSFLPAPHAVLAGLFGRIPSANLELILQLIGISGHINNLNQYCDITLRVYVRNIGRGIADDLFLNTEFKLPTRCFVTFRHSDKTFIDWQFNDRGRHTMVSRDYPPLPPGSENYVTDLKVEVNKAVGDALIGDAIIDIDCGMRLGPGTSVSITFPRTLLEDALAHYSHEYGRDWATKEAGDQRYEALFRECLRRSG